MPDYRRVYLQGGTYFFTVVTYERRPVFGNDAAVDLLWQCFQRTMALRPFTMDAYAILPDHLHAIWTLPDGDADFSKRWQAIKATFSLRYGRSVVGDVSKSMRGKGEKGVWQRRFWEHLIRDESDFERHCDYIHYNPIKHGLVRSPLDWKHSSFGDFVAKGLYDPDWGQAVGKEVLELDLE